MVTIPSRSSKSLTKDTTFANHLLIVDAYSNIPKLYGMENITTEEVMDKLFMFQSRFRKVYEFGWWNMEIIQTESGTQFTSKYFQKGLFVHGLQLELYAPDHQETNSQVEVKCQTLQTITHSNMMHERVSDKYIQFY